MPLLLYGLHMHNAFQAGPLQSLGTFALGTVALQSHVRKGDAQPPSFKHCGQLPQWLSCTLKGARRVIALQSLEGIKVEMCMIVETRGNASLTPSGNLKPRMSIE